MSNSNIGFGAEDINRQWRVEKNDQDLKNIQTRRAEFKDGISKADKTLPQQNAYTQDSRFPKLAAASATMEPGLQSENGENGLKEMPPLPTLTQEQMSKKLEGDASVIFSFNEVAQGEPRVPVLALKGDRVPLNKENVSQFAQKNEVDRGNVRLSYFFSKANPDVKMSPPFTDIQQEVHSEPLLSPETKQLKNQAFTQLLQQADSSGDIQKLALQLGVPPEEVKEMVRDSYLSGGTSPQPEVAKFTQSLSNRAEASASHAQEGEAYSRVVNASEEEINQAAKKLGISPEEVRSMLLQARDNPDADVPSEIKELSEQIMEMTKELLAEPEVNSEQAFEKLLEGPKERPIDSRIAQLAQQLGVSIEEAKSMLTEAFKNPGADLPLSVKRLAAKLAPEANRRARDEAVSQLAGQIFDAKVAGEDPRIVRLAAQLKISLAEAKVLMQKALSNPESVPKAAVNTANMLMDESVKEAFNRIANAPSKADTDNAMGDLYDASFSVELTNQDVPDSMMGKVKFAKQHPELRSQLDPKVIAMLDKADGAVKEGMEKSYGIPQEYTSKAIPTANSDIGAQTYDSLFEAEIAKLRSQGMVTTQDVAQLRQLHYHPESTFPTPQAVQERFKEIESTIIPQVITTLGAPAGWKPKPGLDRSSAVLNGEVGMDVESQLDEMEANGAITSSQKEAVKNALSNSSASSPEDVQALVATVLSSSINNVSAKYGVDPSSIDGMEPLSSGKIGKGMFDFIKNAVRYAEETTNSHESLVHEQLAPGSPMRGIYLEYLLITRTAMQTTKEFLYFMAAGDAERAKNLAIIELEKQLAKLDQMKRAFEAMAEAMEKAEEMGALNIVMQVIMMIIMIIVAAVITVISGGVLAGVAIALVIAVITIMIASMVMTAEHTEGAEEMSWVSMAIQIVVEIILALILAFITAGASIALMTAWISSQIAMVSGEIALHGVYATVKLVVQAILEAIWKMIVDLVTGIIRAVMKAVQDVLSALKTIATAALKGGTVEGVAARLAIRTAIDSVLPAAEVAAKTSETVLEALAKLAYRIAKLIVEEIKTFFMNILRGILQPIESLGKGIMRIGRAVAEAVKETDTIMQAFQRLSMELRAYFTALKEGVTAEEIAAQTEHLQSAASGFTQGTQGIISSEKDQLLADVAYVRTMLDAWLAKVDETIRFMQRYIQKIVQDIQLPVEWIVILSKDQAKFWRQMSQITTGIARAASGAA